MRAPAPATHDAPKQKPDVSCSYILMVQHLIERCLLLYMDREDCVRALAKYARVKPVITNTVWKELEKENKEFFSAYSKHRASRHVRVFSQVLEEATTKLCAQKLECPEILRGSSEAPLQPCPAPVSS
ncbi:hypothetical protein Mp_1g25980 [Marchantia polymorpha subsp. ruderalis]|uniref:Uncharacterized protein n=2 Tax=Marchantia polymorpha TaxID=3197 RepID=A0A176W9K0_MARPO|nr:hypothetical protein AXG93_509s1570 [Marchantia polymorpha subsp. ruderalis]PTQ49829.1 hypothetical protein MARPO_0002s0278 [Marchantia polymorpha]BBN00054.1 hypothetical protein Mp_1g25980 [Marchantia polymorpha subsp. ruderalis]|eukprot:PTQ49829.1 hypothetical protein MARPO_0002s0278 [Marchantia polymorpha]